MSTPRREKFLLRLDPRNGELLRKAEWETRKNKTEIINECLSQQLKRFEGVVIEEVPVTTED